MICKKGGQVPDEHFILSGKALELVSEFNYLGYVISSGGSVQKAINLLEDKAVRSLGMLFSTIKRIQVPFKMLMQLFIHMLNLYWMIVVKSGVSPVQKNVKEFIENS